MAIVWTLLLVGLDIVLTVFAPSIEYTVAQFAVMSSILTVAITVISSRADGLQLSGADDKKLQRFAKTDKDAVGDRHVSHGPVLRSRRSIASRMTSATGQHQQDHFAVRSRRRMQAA